MTEIPAYKTPLNYSFQEIAEDVVSGENTARSSVYNAHCTWLRFHSGVSAYDVNKASTSFGDIAILYSFSLV